MANREYRLSRNGTAGARKSHRDLDLDLDLLLELELERLDEEEEDEEELLELYRLLGGLSLI